MWPSTFHRKSATISGWQCLGDFAAVKQQLQKIRASTRTSKKGEGEFTGSSRPLPPLPGGSAANKSVRFALPEGGQLPSGSEGSDQGYESDQSRERRRQLEMPGLLQRLASLGSGRGGTLTRYDNERSLYGQQKSIQESDRDLSTSSPVLLQLYDAVKVEPDPSSHEGDHVQAAIQRLASSEHLDRSSSYDLVLGLVRRSAPSPVGCRHPPSTPPPTRHSHCPCHHGREDREDRDGREQHHCGGGGREGRELVREGQGRESGREGREGREAREAREGREGREGREVREGREGQYGESRREEVHRQSQRRAKSRPSSPVLSKSRSRPSSPSPRRSHFFSRSRPSSRPSSPRNRPSSPQQQPTKSRWSFGRKAKRSASAERGFGREGATRPGASVELGWRELRPGTLGQWEDTGSRWEWEQGQGSTDTQTAATTAQLAGDLCRRATALRRTLYKMPGLINQRHAFLEIIKDVASEMKLLLDAAGRLAPQLPEQQRAELDLARRKLLETSRSFSNALKGYFKEPQATPVLLAATALVYRTDEIIQALEP